MKKTTLFAPLALTLALGLMTGCTAAAMNSSSSAAASDVAPAGSPSSTVSAGHCRQRRFGRVHRPGRRREHRP